LTPSDVAKWNEVRGDAAHALGQIGAEVAEVLRNEAYQPGTHEVMFNGANVASGIYFYRLKTPEFSSVKKMVLLK